MQIDFLEHPAVDDVIIMSVVLEEVRHRNASVHQRLRALVDSPSKRFFVFVNEHHRCATCLAHTQRRLYTCQSSMTCHMPPCSTRAGGLDAGDMCLTAAVSACCPALLSRHKRHRLVIRSMFWGGPTCMMHALAGHVPGTSRAAVALLSRPSIRCIWEDQFLAIA